MVVKAIQCPKCSSKEIVRYGKSKNGKQRYLCQNKRCKCKTFILDYTNYGYLPEIKVKILDMTVNGSGIRDISRVLNISSNTVISEIKKNSSINNSGKYSIAKFNRYRKS